MSATHPADDFDLSFFDMDGYSAGDLTPLFLRGTATEKPYIASPNTASSSDIDNFLTYETSPETTDFSSFFNDMSALPMFDDSTAQVKSEQSYDNFFGNTSTDYTADGSGCNFSFSNSAIPPNATTANAQAFNNPLISPLSSGSFSPLVSPAPSLFNTSPELDSPLSSFDMFGTDQAMFDGNMSTLQKFAAPAAENKSVVTTTAASAPAALPSTTSTGNPNIKKLEMLRAYAQQPQIRAQLPALLPTIERLAARLQGNSAPEKLNFTWPNASVSSAASLPSPDMDDSPKRRVGRRRKPRPTDPAVIAAEAEAKRQKNTEAARRSRLRKMMKMESMEDQLKKVTEERDALRERVKALEEELVKRR